MYRMVDCGTWDDPWFAELEPAAKLLFLYLLTNRRSTPAGCFEITLRAIAFETGIQPDRINALIPAFGERVRWWPEHQVIWLKNFYKRQMGEKPNPKYREGARKALATMPLEVRDTVSKEYPDLRTAKDAPPAPDTSNHMPHASPIEGASTVIEVVVEPVTEVAVEEIEATPHDAEAPSDDERSDGQIHALVYAFVDGKGLKRNDLVGSAKQKAFRAMQSAPPWATTADVAECTKYMMSDPFWQEPGKLKAQNVVETLPEWQANGRPKTIRSRGRASPSGPEPFSARSELARLEAAS